LPKRSGRQVLQRIRASKHCGDIPVVVLSSSDAPEDKQDALTLGANRYLTKPIDLDDYLQVGQILKTYIEPSG
ncbi:MAG TPA: response regulator, partial [Bryobacteraceae bacterium]|nr:response regulator [Bryobacteraceae bacterium]